MAGVRRCLLLFVVRVCSLIMHFARKENRCLLCDDHCFVLFNLNIRKTGVHRSSFLSYFFCHIFVKFKNSLSKCAVSATPTVNLTVQVSMFSVLWHEPGSFVVIILAYYNLLYLRYGSICCRCFLLVHNDIRVGNQVRYLFFHINIHPYNTSRFIFTFDK